MRRGLSALPVRCGVAAHPFPIIQNEVRPPPTPTPKPGWRSECARANQHQASCRPPPPTPHTHPLVTHLQSPPPPPPPRTPSRSALLRRSALLPCHPQPPGARFGVRALFGCRRRRPSPWARVPWQALCSLPPPPGASRALPGALGEGAGGRSWGPGVRATCPQRTARPRRGHAFVGATAAGEGAREGQIPAPPPPPQRPPLPPPNTPLDHRTAPAQDEAQSDGGRKGAIA